MNVYQDNENLRFEFSEGEGPRRVYISTQGITQNMPLILDVCNAICNYGYGKSNFSKRLQVYNVIKPFVDYLRYANAISPSSEWEWQVFINDFMRFYLYTDISSSASLKTKLDVWNYRIVYQFDLFKDDDLIPAGVNILKAKIRHECIKSGPQKILGQFYSEEYNSIDTLKKLVISTSFSKREVDFLEDIEKECIKNISIIKEVCVSHWDAMIVDHEKGNAYANEISAHQIANVIDEYGNLKKEIPNKYMSVCSNLRPQSHNWAIAICKKLLNSNKSSACVKTSYLKTSPAFTKRTLGEKSYRDVFERDSSLEKTAFNYYQGNHLLYRFSGIFIGLDIAVACMLLTIEHPNFTSHALANAKLLNVRGKDYLLATDGGDRQIFSVDKPRAGCRKSVVLSPRAAEIVKDVIRITSPIRQILQGEDNPEYRYLFLGAGLSGYLGRIRSALTDYLTCDRTLSLTRLYPRLVDNGIMLGNFDFRKVRNTVGVLEWFETGSIREMSNKLGNTDRVALKNYLPAALLDAHCTRIIRRFQNTLIILSCANESFLLEVTDFSEMDELIDFISQLVFDFKIGSSPLGDDIHKKLPKFLSIENCEYTKEQSGLFGLRLSPYSLAHLYALKDFMYSSLPRQVWPVLMGGNGISAQYLFDLARLLIQVCESSDISSSLIEIFDVSLLRKYHEEAMILKTTLLDRFHAFTIVNKG